jgi:hypothetical protein
MLFGGRTTARCGPVICIDIAALESVLSMSQTRGAGTAKKTERLSAIFVSNEHAYTEFTEGRRQTSSSQAEVRFRATMTTLLCLTRPLTAAPQPLNY